MKKYIIELDPLLKNRLRGADTELVSKDVGFLINALEDIEEFDEENYISDIPLKKLESEIEKRRDEEKRRIETNIWNLNQNRDKINNQLQELEEKLKKYEEE